MLALTFSSKLDWASYIISIAKTASKKIGALIRSMKFLSPEVALCFYKSTICPCMEYSCHIWAGAPSCRIVGPSLAASLEPWLIVEMWPALVDFLQNWLNWFYFLFLEGGLLVILIDCMIFLSSFLDVRRMFMSTVSFLAWLNSGILYL